MAIPVISDKIFSFEGLTTTAKSIQDVLHIIPKNNSHVNDYVGGSTVIINSDRLILNAKKEHLFVTGREGVTISSPKSIHIDSDDDIYIFSDTGEIYLGLPARGGEYTPPEKQKQRITKASPTTDYQYEPLVLGLKLANFLEDLVDAIQLLTIVTPNGTANISPENITNLTNIRARIPEMLSTIAFIDGVSHEAPEKGIASEKVVASEGSTTKTQLEPGSAGNTTSGTTSTETSTNLNNTQTATVVSDYQSSSEIIINPDGPISPRRGTGLTSPGTL